MPPERDKHVDTNYLSPPYWINTTTYSLGMLLSQSTFPLNLKNIRVIEAIKIDLYNKKCAAGEKT